MSVTRNDLFGLPIVIVEGRVDFYHCPRLLQTLIGAIDDNHRTIAVDLSEVTSIDESGVELLNAVARCLAKESRRLRILGISAEASAQLAAA